MQSWRDMAAYYANTLDSATLTCQSKSITLDVLEASETKRQQYRSVLDIIDTSRIQFTSLELKDLKNIGALTSKINCWNWNE